jgi:hypothetical protein
MYATGTLNSATGYGSGSSAGYGRGIGMMKTGISPEQMGLKPVDVASYLPKKPETMYDPKTCMGVLGGRATYQAEQQTQTRAIKTPIGLYPSDFMVRGFDIKNTRKFKPEFKQSYN